MDNETKAVEELSTDELEALLAKRKEEERERIQKARTDYEKFVEKATSQIVRKAIGLSKHITNFYNNTTTELEALRDKLNEYGEIKSTSKGGFMRKTKDGNHKVVYRFTQGGDWDERGEKAEGLLKDFLNDFVRKRDLKMFKVVSALLERNKEGKLEYSRVQSLYQLESEFDDPRWKEAIRLFKEGFQPTKSKMRIEIHKRDEKSGKWEPIPLNLSNF